MRPEVEEAFAELQRKAPESVERALVLLQDTIFSFSMKVCGHREDAEDTAQDTVIQAVPALAKIRSPQGLAVWLYKVARSRCLMSRRKSKFAPKSSLSLDELMPDRHDLEALLAAHTADPERIAAAAETAKRIQEAVQQLPPEYRLVLVLHDMEELSNEEVAQVTGLQPATVRVRLHRARLFVRNSLAGKGPRKRAHKAARERGCRELFAALSDYLDHELDASVCDRLEKHMGGCQPCEAFLESLRETIAHCRRHDPGRSDPSHLERIRQGLLREYRRAVEAAGR